MYGRHPVRDSHSSPQTAFSAEEYGEILHAKLAELQVCFCSYGPVKVLLKCLADTLSM